MQLGNETRVAHLQRWQRSISRLRKADKGSRLGLHVYTYIHRNIYYMYIYTHIQRCMNIYIYIYMYRYMREYVYVCTL